MERNKSEGGWWRMKVLFEPYTVSFTLPMIVLHFVLVTFILGACFEIWFVWWFIFRSHALEEGVRI